MSRHASTLPGRRRPRLLRTHPVGRRQRWLAMLVKALSRRPRGPECDSSLLGVKLVGSTSSSRSSVSALRSPPMTKTLDESASATHVAALVDDTPSTSTATSGSRLPYDIISLIIDLCVPSSGTSKTTSEVTRFAQLSLVHSDWYRLVRYRLYRDIALTSSISSQSQILLCRLIARGDRNGVGALVEHLTVATECYAWGDLMIGECPEFHQAMRRMTNMRSMSFYQVDITGAMFTTILGYRHLTDFTWVECPYTCSRLSIPDTVLPALRSVKIHGCSPADESRALVRIFESCASLETLDLDANTTQLALSVIPTTGLPNLRRLYLEPCVGDVSAFCDLLHNAPLLTHLGFSHPRSSPPLPTAPFEKLDSSASSLPNLSRWVGPSALVPYFFGHGSSPRGELSSVALDQIKSVGRNGDVTLDPFAERFVPRSLSSDPEAEKERIDHIQMVLDGARESLESLSIIAGSAASLGPILARGACATVSALDLRIQVVDSSDFSSRLLESVTDLPAESHIRSLSIEVPYGLPEPDIERNTETQQEILRLLSPAAAADSEKRLSLESVSFCAWLSWERSKKVQRDSAECPSSSPCAVGWVPVITREDVVRQKFLRWRARKLSLTGWDRLVSQNGLAQPLGSLGLADLLKPGCATGVSSCTLVAPSPLTPALPKQSRTASFR